MEENKKRIDIHKWIAIGIIIVFILLGSLTSLLFPGTAFETVIDTSIGKFFDVFREVFQCDCCVFDTRNCFFVSNHVS